LTERNGYYAEQNARAMAHAITEVKPNIYDGFEFFGECIGKTPRWKRTEDKVEFNIEGHVFELHIDDIKLDSVRDIFKQIFYETYFKYQI